MGSGLTSPDGRTARAGRWIQAEPQHALLVPFQEVAEVVAPWLERSGATGPSDGLPPHVTLLFPCPGDADAIASVLEGTVAFEVDFRAARRFPRVVWLAPEPAEPLARLTEALVARHLSLRGRAREAVLLAEPEPRRWELVARFPFREG